MTDTVPINVSTCKLGGFWQQEILSKKTKPQYQCCSLFTNAPAGLPMFCPPTQGWCKYQAHGGPEWTKVKSICCSSFGGDLASECPAPPTPAVKASMTPAAAAKTTGSRGTPIVSISQAIGAAIPGFNMVMTNNQFKDTFKVSHVNSSSHFFVENSTFDKPVCFGTCSIMMLI